MKKLSYYFSDFIIGVLTLNYYFIRKVIMKEIPNINAVRVLDFGCGTGVLTNMFCKNKYIGFDFDAEAISFASEKRSGYRFKVGDATSFRTSRRFDLVLIVGVLHHLDDLEVKRAALVINRLLATNGKALIIEATHSLKKCNLIGNVLRRLDKGSNIRYVEEYSKLLSNDLNVNKKYRLKGGVLDYAVLVASNKHN